MTTTRPITAISVAALVVAGLYAASPSAAKPGSSAPAAHHSVASAPKLAATSVTLGQTSGVAPIGCSTTYSGVQSAVAGPPSYTTPSAGVITSFSHQADVDPGQIRALLFIPSVADRIPAGCEELARDHHA